MLRLLQELTSLAPSERLISSVYEQRVRDIAHAEQARCRLVQTVLDAYGVGASSEPDSDSFKIGDELVSTFMLAVQALMTVSCWC